VIARRPGKGTVLLQMPDISEGKGTRPLVAVVICGELLGIPFYGQMLHGILNTCEMKTDVIVQELHDPLSNQAQEYFNKLFSERKPDGVVLLGDISIRLLPLLNTFNRPVVVVGVPVDAAIDALGIPSVQVHEDFFNIYHRAVQYLTSLGHKRIAFIQPLPHPAYTERYNGFVRGLEEAGIPVSNENRIICRSRITSIHDKSVWHQPITDFLDHVSRFTAVVCVGQDQSLELISQLHERGMRMPKDLSVIASNDSNELWASTLGITTIESNGLVIGKIAAERMLNQVTEGKKAYGVLTIPMELKIRSSCGPCK